MVTAARQDMWRVLRSQRGLAPVVWIAATDGGAAITLAACYLDSARAPASVVQALAGLTHPDRVAAWRRQCGG